MANDIDPAVFRRLLEEECAALLAESEAASAGRAPVTLDQQSVGRLSRMDAMQVQAMALATENRRQDRLRRIAAALGRIEAGTYGYCRGCEEDIPVKRLEIDPCALTCVDCAAQSSGT